MNDRPSPLRIVSSEKPPTAAEQRAAAFFEALSLIAAASEDALAHLQDGALRAIEVCDAPEGQLLKPAVRDAMKRLGEHVRRQVNMIGRMN